MFYTKCVIGGCLVVFGLANYLVSLSAKYSRARPNVVNGDDRSEDPPSEVMGSWTMRTSGNPRRRDKLKLRWQDRPQGESDGENVSW